MAAPKAGTRDRILDAAEYLFATKGYDGASTRDIVARTGDTIGSVNYHFGSKQELLREVVARRWLEMTERRRAAYQAARTRHDGSPPIDEVVAAIVLPYLEIALKGGKGWRNYMMLQARLFFSPGEYNGALRELSEPVARELIGWIREAMPEASPADVGYAFQFTIGLTVESAGEAGIDRISRLTDGACSLKDFDAIGERLVRFISSGIRDICG